MDETENGVIEGQEQDGSDNETEDWKDYISEELRGAEEFNGINSFDELATAYISAKKMALPQETIPNDEAGYDAFFKKNGMPAAASGYSFRLSDDANDDAKIFADGMKEAAFEGKLTDRQFTSMMNKFYDIAQNLDNERVSNIEKERNDVLNKYALELGDQFEPRMSDLNLIVHSVGPEFADHLAKIGAGFDPVIIEGLLKLGDGFVEKRGGLVRSDGQRISTSKQIDQKIEELQSDPAYCDPRSPKHKYLIDEVRRLFEVKFS